MRLTTIFSAGRVVWALDYAGTPEAASVRHLCGGTIVPTPYTAHMSRVDVIRRLAAVGTIIID